MGLELLDYGGFDNSLLLEHLHFLRPNLPLEIHPLDHGQVL